MALVSAEPVREHVLKLRAAGGTYESIGRAAGTGAMTVHCITNARRPRVQADVASRLLAVSEAEVRSWRPSSHGIMWRLRALVAMGHTCSRMAAATDVSPTTLRRIVRGEAVTISPALREAVVALFDTWWDKVPSHRARPPCGLRPWESSPFMAIGALAAGLYARIVRGGPPQPT